MELKDFVTTSLTQIIDGIVEAQKHAKANGAFINPRALQYNQNGKPYWLEEYDDPDNRHQGQILHFDVAVSASESDQAEGKIRVSALVLDVGVGGEVDTTTSTISRLKFSIPVFFPEQ